MEDSLKKESQSIYREFSPLGTVSPNPLGTVSPNVYHFSIYNNIVIMSTELIQNYPNLYYKLINISLEYSIQSLVCKTMRTKNIFCSFYKNCASIIFIYFDSTNINKNNLDKFTNLIKGFFIVINKKNIAEIHNIYITQKEYITLFKIVTIILNKINLIWIGIIMDRDDFEDIIKFYYDIGFRYNKITNKTYFGESIGCNIMTLIYDKKSISLKFISTPFEIIIALRNGFLKLYNSCKTTFYISDNLANYLKKFIYEDREYGAPLFIIRYEDIARRGKKEKVARIIFYKQFLNIATDDKKYQVNITYNKPHFINFHTHPNVCIGHYDCYLQYYSSKDIGNLVLNYTFRGNLIAILVTIEGVYILKITSHFSLMLRNIMEYMNNTYCNVNINGLIENEVEEIQEKRILSPLQMEELKKKGYTKENFYKGISEQEIRKKIVDFLNFMNNLTIYKLLKSKVLTDDDKELISDCFKESNINKLGDFKLFNVEFYTWQYIKKNKGIFTDVMNIKDKINDKCPLETFNINTEDYIF